MVVLTSIRVFYTDDSGWFDLDIKEIGNGWYCGIDKEGDKWIVHKRGITQVDGRDGEATAEYAYLSMKN